MSMYGLVMGDGSEATRGKVLLAILGNPEIPRFRDAWVEVADGEPRIAIYTRTGGNNRDCWVASYNDAPETANGPECGCAGCLQTYNIPAHELFIKSEDQDFDNTYQTSYFRVPPEHRDALLAIAVEPVDMSDRWMQVIEALKK